MGRFRGAGGIDCKVYALRRVAGTVGSNEIHWDGRDDAGQHASSGIYYYKLTTADGTATRKIALVK